MAKKVVSPVIQPLSQVFDRYEWRFKPFSLETCELWHGNRRIAFIKRWGMFPVRRFSGKILEQRFELEKAKQQGPGKSEALQYSFKMEEKKNMWKEGGGKKEIGTLEYAPSASFGGRFHFWTGWEGPSNINIPAKITIHGVGEYSIGERIEGPGFREYSIIDRTEKNEFRILAKTTRPPEGEICGTFERYDVKKGDPDSLLLAILSFAFAQIVYLDLDAKG